MDTTFRLVAATLSAGAALVSILTFVLNHRRATIAAAAMTPPAGTIGVERIKVTPLADTAYALGDTIQLTALPVDARGLALLAAQVQWLVDDSSVARVDSSGQVTALRPGVTSVTIAAGGRAARARIWVLPRVVSLDIEGDSVVEVDEGREVRLGIAARDARGNRVGAAGLRWTVADREIAAVDSFGRLDGVTPGATMVSASAAGLLAQRPVHVLPVPASITLAAGADQRSAAGTRLSGPVTVQVVSRSGRPVPEALVRFDPSAARGRVEPESLYTDARGRASALWTLGDPPGRQRLAVVVPGVDSPLAVSAEADPVPARTRILLLGDSLHGPAGTRLDEPVAVQVTDTTGVALADVPVAWTALDGGALVATEARTDSLGMVRARWTLGPKAGRQRARVQVGNPRSLPPMHLAAVAEPGRAVALRAVSGDRQTGAAGGLLPQAIVLEVHDSLGNPVPDVPVRLAPGSGSVVDSLVRSDARGRVLARWTLPTGVGPARLGAKLETGTRGIELTATGTPGPAAALTVTAGPKSGPTGKPLARTVDFRVTDRHGNPVAGTPLTLSLTAGRVAQTRVTTDEHGTVSVRWTLGTRAGRQSLTARTRSGQLKATHQAEAIAPKPKPAATAPRPAPKPAAPAATGRSPLGTSAP